MGVVIGWFAAGDTRVRIPSRRVTAAPSKSQFDYWGHKGHYTKGPLSAMIYAYEDQGGERGRVGG